jgi:hypothetical protein
MATDQLTRTFRALADPTRRAILGRLTEGEASVREQAGLITRGRTAQLRPSRLHAVPLKDAVDWLEGYRRFWEGGFDRMEARLAAGEDGPAGG